MLRTPPSLLVVGLFGACSRRSPSYEGQYPSDSVRTCTYLYSQRRVLGTPYSLSATSPSTSELLLSTGWSPCQEIPASEAGYSKRCESWHCYGVERVCITQG